MQVVVGTPIHPGRITSKPEVERGESRLARKSASGTLIFTEPEFGNIVPSVFTPVLAKHSKSFSLIDCISVGVDRMQRNFEPMRKQVEAWQRSELTDVTAKVVIHEAFVEGKLEAPKHLARTVHDLYFEPKYEEFRPRTIWSLSNAFTSAFKELDPIPQFKATAKLARPGSHNRSSTAGGYGRGRPSCLSFHRPASVDASDLHNCVGPQCVVSCGAGLAAWLAGRVHRSLPYGSRLRARTVVDCAYGCEKENQEEADQIKESR